MTRISQDELCGKINRDLKEQKFPQGEGQTPDEQAGSERIEAQKELTGEHSVTILSGKCDPEYKVVSFFKWALNKLKT